MGSSYAINGNDDDYGHADTPPVKELQEMGSPLKLMPLHANGWLNEMKVSSPTSIRVNIGNPSAFDPIYRAWTVSCYTSNSVKPLLP